QMLAELAGFRGVAEQVLGQVREPGYTWPAEAEEPIAPNAARFEELLLRELCQWPRANRAAGDCPLPDLFDQIKSAESNLTIGLFHDCLRRLYDEGRVYLHPWTGPLHEIPEPNLALMMGHIVAYYVSSRIVASG
ncbi:MAG: hypothetical protein ACRD36_13595, partial [Candidatus Acidiferrum sp.]